MSTPPSGHPLLTIVVYNEILNQNKWLTLFFEKYPWNVELAIDGKDLFDKTVKLKPDVVMMDVMMPIISGLDCLRMIRAQEPGIQTVLLSSIGSHSIGHHAVELEVDLYCDQARRSASIVRFLKTRMGLDAKKPKSSKATKTLSGADLSQRMKDRYPVTGSLLMEFDGQDYAGVFENISMEGAKIRVSQIPPLSSPINLKWTFKGSPPFVVHGLTVRQTMVFEPVDEFVWVVGIKFINLDLDLIKNLSELISRVSTFYEQKFEFVDFEQIRKMLGRQEKYFYPILQGQRAPSLIEKAMKEIKQYERDSFHVQDEDNLCIAKLMSFRIICRVLRRSLDWVQIHPDDGLKQCVPLIMDILQKIDSLEADTDALIREATNVEVKKQLVESSNLILEQKDKLVQTFYDLCHGFTPEESFKSQFDSIIKRYEDLQSYQHFLEVEAQEQQKKKIKPLEQKPLYQMSQKTIFKKEQIDVATKRKTEIEKIRKNIIPTVSLGIVVSTILYFGLNFYHSFVPPQEVRLSLAVQKIRIKNTTSLEVFADVRTWNALEPGRKLKVMDELEVFLTARGLYQAKILDGGVLIAAVYSTHDDDKLRFGYDIFVH